MCCVVLQASAKKRNSWTIFSRLCRGLSPREIRYVKWEVISRSLCITPWVNMLWPRCMFARSSVQLHAYTLLARHSRYILPCQMTPRIQARSPREHAECVRRYHQTSSHASPHQPQFPHARSKEKKHNTYRAPKLGVAEAVRDGEGCIVLGQK